MFKKHRPNTSASNKTPWPTNLFPSTNLTTEEQLEGGPSKLCWSRSLGESQRSSGVLNRGGSSPLPGERDGLRRAVFATKKCLGLFHVLRVVVKFFRWTSLILNSAQKKEVDFTICDFSQVSIVHQQNPAPGDIGNTLALKCWSIHLHKFLCATVHKGCLGPSWSPSQLIELFWHPAKKKNWEWRKLTKHMYICIYIEL